MHKNKRSYSFWIYQIPAIGCALLIFILSSIPGDNLPDFNVSMGDKLQHIIAYSVLGFLMARAMFYQTRFPGWRNNYIAVVLIIGILFGISDEFHQNFVPGRFMDVMDLVADSIGICLGLLVFRFRAAIRRFIPILR